MRIGISITIAVLTAAGVTSIGVANASPPEQTQSAAPTPSATPTQTPEPTIDPAPEETPVGTTAADGFNFTQYRAAQQPGLSVSSTADGVRVSFTGKCLSPDATVGMHGETTGIGQTSNFCIGTYNEPLSSVSMYLPLSLICPYGERGGIVVSVAGTTSDSTQVAAISCPVVDAPVEEPIATPAP